MRNTRKDYPSINPERKLNSHCNYWVECNTDIDPPFLVEENRMNEDNMITEQSIARKIGGITYLVGVHFSEGATETLGEKLKRMMKTECEGAKSV